MIICMYAFKLPESPRWLCAKGKNEEALAVLAALEGQSVDDKKSLRMLQGIRDAVAAETAGAFSFKDLLSHGRGQNFRRTMLGILAQCFQQISGIKWVTSTS